MGAMKRSLKGKSGNTIRMERYIRLSPNTVPLGNSGITPAGKNLESIYIDAKISFYGDYVKINEQLPITSQSPVLNQATIRLGEQMRETEDQLMRDMLATTATVLFSTGGVNGKSPTEMTLTDIQDAVKTLLSNDAKTISSSIEGTNKFGTAPVSNAYVAMGHTDLSSTLSNMSGFTRTYQYGSQAGIKQTEWGAVDSVRFFLSSVGSKSEGAADDGSDVYNTFICGMEAYANIELDNYKSQMIYRDGKYDGPLAQNQTVAWKMAEAQVITNDAWVLNLKSTLA